MCKVRQAIFLMICLLGMSAAYAESYYLKAANSIQISAEKLQESTDKVNKHKDIKVIDALEVPPFHKRGLWEQESLNKTFCTGCHLSPPHSKDLRSRTFLNMHTEFIACETCHMRPENVKFSYQWFDYRTQQTSEPAVEKFRQIFSEEDRGKPGEERRKTNHLIKIVPFYKGEVALILRDHDFAQQSLTLWEKGVLSDKAAHRAKIHAPLKEKGPECKACHQSEQPFLDLNVLGANKMQIRSMQRHIVPQFFKRYSEKDQKIKIDSLLK